eukprot:1139738-Pelagomonas_calceolata.AAC.4
MGSPSLQKGCVTCGTHLALESTTIAWVLHRKMCLAEPRGWTRAGVDALFLAQSIAHAFVLHCLMKEDITSRILHLSAAAHASSYVTFDVLYKSVHKAKALGLHSSISPPPASFASELMRLLARNTRLDNKYHSMLHLPFSSQKFTKHTWHALTTHK